MKKSLGGQQDKDGHYRSHAGLWETHVEKNRGILYTYINLKWIIDVNV